MTTTGRKRLLTIVNKDVLDADGGEKVKEILDHSIVKIVGSHRDIGCSKTVIWNRLKSDYGIKVDKELLSVRISLFVKDGVLIPLKCRRYRTAVPTHESESSEDDECRAEMKTEGSSDERKILEENVVHIIEKYGREGCARTKLRIYLKQDYNMKVDILLLDSVLNELVVQGRIITGKYGRYLKPSAVPQNGKEEENKKERKSSRNEDSRGSSMTKRRKQGKKKSGTSKRRKSESVRSESCNSSRVSSTSSSDCSCSSCRNSGNDH